MSQKENSEYPKRAHSVEIRIGADTKEDLLVMLREAVREVEKGESVTSNFGSAAFGGIIDYRVDKSMTHDKYFELLEDKIERDTLGKGGQS